jgi:DNA-binding CsgD family transcriptional regulator/tetratricopeptide (TPR) repeat protein
MGTAAPAERAFRPVTAGVLSDPDASMEDMAQIRASSAFVGRALELARLEQLLASASDGAASGVLLGGDAGVGKTRLSAELAARAAAGGAVAVIGRCVDLGAGGLPYLPFTEALGALAADPGARDTVRQVAADRPALRRLTGLLDGAAGSDDALHRLPLYDAVGAVLRAVGDAVAPVLLVLEDLHWADASTRDLLRFLLARLSEDRLLVLATYRTDEMHRRHPLRGLLAELVRLPRVERLGLNPFDDAELRAYLQSLQGGEVAESVVRDIRARSEGNAFYAEELLVAAADPVAAPSGGFTAAGAGRLPGGLADVLLSRLERLPEAVQHFTRVASVAGRRVPDALLRAASERPADETEQALRDAVAHHLLVSDGVEQFAFRHALVQEAVYADLLPGERIRLHARYAALLAADPAGANAADLARHCVEAHDLPGALAAWIRAAQQAGRRLAPAEALAHFEQALQLWVVVAEGDRPPGWSLVSLGSAAAAAASQAGDVRRAISLGRDATQAAVTMGDRELEADTRHRLAHYLYSAERDDEALDEVARVYQVLEGSPPVPARVWAATVEARVIGGWGQDWTVRRDHMLRNRSMVQRALTEARQLELVGAEADLLVSMAVTDGIISGPEAAAERLAEARRLGMQAQDPAIALRAQYHLATNQLDAGDLDAALSTFREALAYAERVGLSSSLFGVEARVLYAQTLVTAGHWDAAVLAVTRDRPRLPAREALFLRHPVLPVYTARDPQQALASVRELIDCDPDYPVARHVLAGTQADALTWLADTPAAVAVIRSTLQAYQHDGTPMMIGGIQLCALGLAALADGVASAPRSYDGRSVHQRLADGEQLLSRAREIGEHGPTRLRRMGPEGRAWLLRAEAEAARLRGQPDVPGWRAAWEAYGYGHVYERARSGWRLAEALLTAGPSASDRAEAADLTRSARETAVALGARPLRDAVDALGRRHRLDVGAGVPASEVLTPREQEVMRLVADGLTNKAIGARLFISEKTASVHVSHVLAKLGASGRAEAVAVAHRRGLLQAQAAEHP